MKDFNYLIKQDRKDIVEVVDHGTIDHEFPNNVPMYTIEVNGASVYADIVTEFWVYKIIQIINRIPLVTLTMASHEVLDQYVWDEVVE